MHHDLKNRKWNYGNFWKYYKKRAFITFRWFLFFALKRYANMATMINCCKCSLALEYKYLTLLLLFVILIARRFIIISNSQSSQIEKTLMNRKAPGHKCMTIMKIIHDLINILTSCCISFFWQLRTFDGVKFFIMSLPHQQSVSTQKAFNLNCHYFFRTISFQCSAKWCLIKMSWIYFKA